MNSTRKIPAEHRYSRILNKARKELNTQLTLLTSYNYAYFLIIVICFVFFRKSSWHNLNILAYIKILISNTVAYTKILISLIIQNYLVVLGILVICIGFVLILQKPIAKLKEYNKSLFIEGLHKTCKILIQHNIFLLLLDPNLIYKYESRNPKIKSIIKVNLNLSNPKTTPRIHNFSDYLGSDIHIYILALDLIDSQFPRLAKDQLFKRKSIFVSCSIILALSILIPIGLLIFAFGLNYFPAEILYILLPVSVVSGLIYGYFHLFNKLSLPDVSSYTILSFFKVQFVRDPEHDYQMFDYRRIHPDLTYEYIVTIIESYLYPKQDRGDKVNTIQPKVSS